MAASPQRFRVLISGASGMVGKALEARLSQPSAANYFRPEVCRLVRHEPQSPTDIRWDPASMRIDVERLEGFDAVVHLAGENVGSGDGFLAFTGRWTDRKKRLIMESRRRGTTLLAQALACLKEKPSVFVSASGVGYYGSRGEEVLTESSSRGNLYLSEVAEVWENCCAPASKAGIRVVNARFGMIMSRTDGAIAKLVMPFSLGLGGPIGSGAQFVSWVTLEDAVRALEHAIRRPEVSGPVNVVAPSAVTMAEFTGTLAAALHRPALIPMPEFVVKAVFGQMGEETLLASTRAEPRKLLASGFTFLHADIKSGIEAALHPARDLIAPHSRSPFSPSHGENSRP